MDLRISSASTSKTNEQDKDNPIPIRTNGYGEYFSTFFKFLQIPHKIPQRIHISYVFEERL